MSVITAVLALAIAGIAWLWTGERAFAFLAGAIVLVSGVNLGMELFFGSRRTGANNNTGQDNAR